MELDTVVQHYITALLWSETADSGEPLDSTDYELSQAAINTAEGDCESFLEVHAALVAELPDWYTAAQLGHDFLLTRNGHGVGFWDRGLGDLGQQLTAAAQSYGTIHAFINGDFKIDTE